MTNSQIHKLGKKLRKNPTEEDLKRLDEFRRTYDEIDNKANSLVQELLEEQKGYNYTPRKRKTQQSIIAKLRRSPNMALYNMQDVAGCRIVLEGELSFANKIIAILEKGFSQSSWEVEVKERDKDGYRATHIIVKQEKKCFEIQVRTFAQNVWANIVEQLCDESNSLKYGGSEGEQELMKKLVDLSERFCKLDKQSFNVLADYHEEIKKEIEDVLSN